MKGNRDSRLTSRRRESCDHQWIRRGAVKGDPLLRAGPDLPDRPRGDVPRLPHPFRRPACLPPGPVPREAAFRSPARRDRRREPAAHRGDPSRGGGQPRAGVPARRRRAPLRLRGAIRAMRARRGDRHHPGHHGEEAGGGDDPEERGASSAGTEVRGDRPHGGGPGAPPEQPDDRGDGVQRTSPDPGAGDGFPARGDRENPRRGGARGGAYPSTARLQPASGPSPAGGGREPLPFAPREDAAQPRGPLRPLHLPPGGRRGNDPGRPRPPAPDADPPRRQRPRRDARGRGAPGGHRHGRTGRKKRGGRARSRPVRAAHRPGQRLRHGRRGPQPDLRTFLLAEIGPRGNGASLALRLRQAERRVYLRRQPARGRNDVPDLLPVHRPDRGSGGRKREPPGGPPDAG